MTDIPKAIETAKRLRALAAAATPGEWTLAYHDKNDQAVVSGGHTEVCTFWHHCVGALATEMEANASFVTAARNDTPLLCDAVEELAKENERLLGILDMLQEAGAIDHDTLSNSQAIRLDRALAEKE